MKLHLPGVVSADQDLATARYDRRGWGAHWWWRDRRLALFPAAFATVVDPCVVQCGGLIVAAEHDHQLADRIVDDRCVTPQRRFDVQLRPAPRIAGTAVDPRWRSASRVGGQSAAKQQHLVPQRIVAHAGPRDGATGGGMVLRLQVRPGVRGRVQCKGETVAVVDDAFAPRVPAGHIERVDGTRASDAVEVPPSDAVGVMVPAHTLQTRSFVVIQTVRAGLPVDAKRRKLLVRPHALHGARKRR